MKTLTIFTWLTLIVLATSWFFFYPGMFYVHDFLHTARIAEMARGLSDGHFPVRWSQNFGYGYGMPLFEFYAPLPFYVGALFLLLGLPGLFVTKLLFILCNIGTVLASFKLGKTLFGRVGGLVVAAAISLAPYRAVNLYVRGALSEAWGMMAAIWVLFFTIQVLREKRYSWVGLTISLVVLFLSHNLTTLIFLPVAAVFTIFFFAYRFSVQRKKVAEVFRVILKVAGSYFLAVGISAFYLVPAFVEKNLTQVSEIIVGGYFDYSIHFVYLRQFIQPHWGYGGSNWGPHDDISFFLGFGQILAVALSVLYITVALLKPTLRKGITLRKILLFIGILVLGIFSLLLSTEKLSWIWQHISLLQYVQFPWRFLGVAAIFLGITAPIFLYSQPKFVSRWLIGWLVLLVCFVNAIYFRPESFLENTEKYYTTEASAIRSELSEVLPDYLPLGFPRENEPAGELVTCRTVCDVSVEKDQVHSKYIVIDVQQETTILLAVSNYPGWVTLIDGNYSDHETTNGLISLDIPEGTSTVEVIFRGTQIRNWSDSISLVSFALFLMLVAYSRIHAKQHDKK